MLKFSTRNALHSIFKKKNLLPLLSIFLLIALFTSLFAFNKYYSNKIYSHVQVAELNVGSKTREQALEALKKNVKTPEKITLLVKDQNLELSLSDVGFSYNLESVVDSAFSVYRNKSPLTNFFGAPFSLIAKTQLRLQPSLNQDQLSEYLQIIQTQLALEPKPPRAYLVEGEVQIDKGAPGESIEKEEFEKKLLSKLAKQDFSPTEVPFIETDPVITDEEAAVFEKRAESLIGKTIFLTHEYSTFTLKDKDLMSFLSAKDSFDDESVQKYIEKELFTKVNRESQNAVFNFENGKVVEFRPAKNGATINQDVLKRELYEKISSLETTDEKSLTLEIPIESAPPKITTEQVNDLGINELLGRGTSKFRGSIPGRIFNIGLASSKINGALVPPDDTFSFNDTVGDISTLTGYKQAYIIKDGRTVLGDGGGVCQVSTTLFRAVLDAGLPIVERHAHSYRVGYYEQDSKPGIDATVFSPTSDLKFKNDTPGHLLIQTIFNPENVSLVFEIYGTSDGREAIISTPIITSVTEPPDDLYIDDPSLPAGQIKQIDHKAWGAKVNFKYKVERGGETLIDKTFYSNYQPWQSVFLRGTGPTT